MAQENADQKKFWESFADLWVTNQSALDGLMNPVLEGVFERANLKPGQKVLDIGCGTGTSSLRAARDVGPSGRIVGADISEPMLACARRLASGIDNLHFETTDVADHAFEPASFDSVISRFGVMFFVDPCAAFTNVRKAMKPGARLTMACWSNLDANPWFRVPMYAAKEQLGAPPSVDADAPGPLAFRNIDRVCGILVDAGFGGIEGKAETLLLTPPGDLHHAAQHAASIGPAARALEYFDATDSDFDAIVQTVEKGFSDYASPEGVHVPAEINFFMATAPQA